jgi:pyruvate/2-oxoglutarate dehydrogenase complex dihydrolipoamide dehydrogenase (E3) component
MEAAMLKRAFAKGSSSPQLTPEQEAEAQRLAELIAAKTQEDVLKITRMLVSKPDYELLGETEFQVRDLVHQIGARAIETALNERKKGGTKGRA